MAAGFITLALTATSPTSPTSPSLDWNRLNAAPWSYKSLAETKQLHHTTHCYKWLPLKMKTIQKVSKNKKKK